MRILIAGCGYVGSALAGDLAGEGHDVFGMRRHPVGLPAGVTPLAADLTSRSSLAAAVPGELDAVVYAVSSDSRDLDDYRRAYVEGLANLLEALSRPGPRVLFTSSTSVYGQDDGSWVDETSETIPRQETGRILLEGEASLAESGRPFSILRLGGIYGPNRTRLLSSVRSGASRLPAEHDVYTNRIHRDDAARALGHLLKLPAVAPLYLGVDDDPADLATVLRWLAARMGVSVPAVAEPGERAETARGRRTRKRCRNDRLRGTGFEFRYPSFREGYDSILEAWTSEGEAGESRS